MAVHAGFLVFRSDEVRKELAGTHPGTAALERDFGDGLYTPEWNERTYAECLRRAEVHLFEGRRVLIDASFREDARRRRFVDAARRWGITACLILSSADPEVVRVRLAARRDDASDAGWAIYQEAARHWEDFGTETSRVVHPIDTGASLEQVSTRALSLLLDSGLFDLLG